MLDVGCGTGQHAVLLAAKGHAVTAIDLSPDMIRIARGKNSDVDFLAGDIALLPNSGFDFSYSLFNVINCLGSLDQLISFFRHIADRLNAGATFLVESWNPIAVIAVPPTVVERVYQSGDERIVRKVTPSADFFRQHLDLRYDIEVFGAEPGNDKRRGFSVTHELLLFTPLEIEYCLSQAGFANIAAHTALPDRGTGDGP